MNKNKRAFTLVELLVVISIIALLVGLLLPAIGRARKNAQQVKCMTQIRAIHQGLVAWSSTDRERYPVPSVFDKDDQTEDHGNGVQRGIKDRTGNLWSILMFHKVVAEPETYVSPAEANANIRPIRMGPGGVNGAYEFQTVRPGDTGLDGGVANTQEPSAALWDPSFKGAPVLAEDQGDGLESDVPEGIGNNSYAHVALRGQNYRDKWSALFASPSVPVVCNRGPLFKFTSEIPDTADDYELDDTGSGAAGVNSMTLLIHGGKSTWEGNVGYNDGHVAFETSFAPEELTLRDKANVYPDNLFVSEIIDDVHSELREDAFLMVYKRGMDFATGTSDQTHAFNPQAARNTMWYDGQ